MCAKRIRKSGRGQAGKYVDQAERSRVEGQMAEVGFVAGTQKAYLREYDRFPLRAARRSLRMPTSTGASCPSVRIP